MRKVCFIQCHYTNITEDADAQYFCVEKIRDSGLFDEVVLAAADVPENKIFYDLAEKWGVKVFLGSPDNMLQRMQEVAKDFDCQVLARVLLYWFYLDVALIGRMMALLEKENADYVNLPLNFDIKFGADVHSLSGLNKVDTQLRRDQSLFDEYKFRPWFYIEENKDELWKVVTCKDVPTYSNKTHEETAEKIIASTPWAWDYGKVFYYHEYVFAAKRLGDIDTVLDLSCGWGSGTNILADVCKTAIGADVSESLIESARGRFDKDNLSFIVTDGQELTMPDDSVDAVVSIHTMEHVEDDALFLSEIKRALKPGGTLMIEVPLRMRFPFVHNDNPFVPKTDDFPGHVREYTPEGFQRLVERFFNVEEVLGDNRGSYCSIGQARNAVMIIAKNI